MSELKIIEYMIKIADEGSITRAAEQLFLTQSALNQQLLKLEKELGVQLFQRSKQQMTPTAAGLIYLSGARQILDTYKHTQNEISDYLGIRNSHIRVGLTPGRGPKIFVSVYPHFHRLYPNVQVEPVEMSVHQQQRAITNGSLDLGFVTLTESQRSNNHYDLLFKEEFLIALPKMYPLNEDELTASGRYPELPLERLRHEPFALIKKNSTMARLVDPLFLQAGFQPDILFRSSRDSTILSMVSAQICAGIVPEIYANSNAYPEVKYYSLPSHPSWDFCVSYSRSIQITQAAREFIRLTKELWRDKYQK